VTITISVALDLAGVDHCSGSLIIAAFIPDTAEVLT
jgi:hypothetical protein